MIRVVSASQTQSRVLPPAAVLDAYGLSDRGIRPNASGLINATWHVVTRSGAERVLQRVNPLFPPQIHADIEIVTRHLAAKGLLTPMLIPCRAGASYFEHGGEIWRLMTRIDGRSLQTLSSPEQAAAAGQLLGQFHLALGDLEHEFAQARLGVHDTQRHLRLLEQTLQSHADHAEIATVRPLAEELLAFAETLPPLPAAPDRIVHGDPKVSNILFDDADRALCLIDLDTLGTMPVALELGDAYRSWCNTAAEDGADPRFSAARFKAAARGYAAGAPGLLQPAEYAAIPPAVLTITTELAVRFCTDALRESYFAWDRRRYPSASRHNLARARAQLMLARSVAAQADALHEAVAAIFAQR